MTNLQKALEVLIRLPQTESLAVNDITAVVRAVSADALKTLLEQEATIARLSAENKKLLEGLQDAEEAGYQSQHELPSVDLVHEGSGATPSRSCNLHNDCDLADAAGIASGVWWKRAEHCHNDDCEECFGR